MPVEYAALEDPGLVRIGEDSKTPDPRSGLVTVIRPFRCRKTFLENARALLVRGTVLEEGSRMYLEDFTEAEEVGYYKLSARYLGIESLDVLQNQPRPVQSMGFSVMTVQQVSRVYTLRVGYPVQTFSFVEANEAARRTIAPSFRASDVSIQTLKNMLVGEFGDPNSFRQRIYCVPQIVKDDRVVYHAHTEYTISIAFEPIIFGFFDTPPANAVLVFPAA